MQKRVQIWQLVDETVADLKGDPKILPEIIAELTEYNDELPANGKIGLTLQQGHEVLTELMEAGLKIPEAGLLAGFGEVIGVHGSAEVRLIPPAGVRRLAQALKSTPFEQLPVGEERVAKLSEPYNKLSAFIMAASRVNRWILSYLV
jgi:hypothetical protein